MSNSTINELLDDVDRIGGIDSNRYSDTDKMRSFTNAAHSITQEIMEAMSDSDFQGEKSIHNLVADQREYLLPTDILKIKRIDLKLDGTNWKKSDWLDESQIANNYVTEADIIKKFNNSNPYVSLFDESFFIYSGTITNVTGGIQISYDKEIVGQDNNGDDITDFSATTDIPTLKEFAAQGLVYWAIIDWYTAHPDKLKFQQFNLKLWGNPNGRPADRRQIGGLMKQIIEHYTNRVPDKIIVASSQYTQEDFE